MYDEAVDMQVHHLNIFGGQRRTVLELTFSFNSESKIPNYEQLYLFVRQEIESGRIAAGTQLPSIRGLSDSLKISKTTVEEAYQQLTAEGYITSKARVGYFSLPPQPAFGSMTTSLTKENPVTPQVKYLTEIDFHPSRVDGDHFPKAIMRKITNDIWKKFDNALLDSGEVQGEWGLRSELASYLRHSRGVRCSPEQIVIGSGIQYTIHLLMGVLQTEISAVAMEDPGYDGVRSVFERIQVPVCPISLEHDGINLEDLRTSKAELVYVTPSHQFPQGMVMSYSKRMQLLQWAKENGGYIIEDDYDGEFRYSERPIPALQGLDSHETVIYIGTFSKALAPSFRLNYMVLPPSLIHPFLSQFQHQDSPVPRLQQVMLQQFMHMGHWEKHIRRMRRVYRHKHSVLIEAIRSEMGDNVTIKGHGAGLHVALDLNTNYSEHQLAERAASVGVRVYFSSKNYARDVGQGPLVLLGFAGLSSLDIVEGVKRLHRCWFQADQICTP